MSILVAIFFYFAVLAFAAGLIYRIGLYARTPAPLKIPTTPAPTTRGGVVLRMTREVVLFESLFKGNLWTWAMGWLFHVSLALVTLRHLRYFLDPVPGWVAAVQPFGQYAGITMVIGLCGLWVRRLFVERIRYISTPSDHLWLVVLIVIGLSGLLMSFVVHTDVVGVKNFFVGLLQFRVGAVPSDMLLLTHLFLVFALLALFPISKLLHAPGVFFSPTRNQTDNPREHRHLSAWASKLESEN